MSKTWEEKWTEDINYLSESLIVKHENLFFNVSRLEFEDRVSYLKSMINSLDYEEMKVELSRLVASVKDAHTAITFPVNKFLPIKFYYFSDGIYIVDTSKKYKKLLGKKVISIDNTKIEDVLSELAMIISYENEYFFKAQVVKYMQAADVLYGALICDDMNEINIKVCDINRCEDVKINTVNSKELKYIENEKLPIHLKRSSENYWFEYIEENQEMYIKYNSCRECGEELLCDKIDKTIKFIEEHGVSKVTIDLRHNLGGDSSLIQPLLNFVKNSKEINRRGNLKVIIGRETFSSGLLNAYEFKFETKAILVGEPSGGKPNCYGEILRFTLPNSGFQVSYSTKFYRVIDDDSVMALYPDEIIEENIEDIFMFLR